MTYRHRDAALWRSQEAERAAPTAAPASAAASSGKRAHFTGADVSRLTASWTTTAIHHNNALYADLRVLRARCRELVRNNEYARKFIKLVRTNVVGPEGFGLQVHALRRDGKIDKADSDRCEAAFWTWCQAGNCDVTGQMGFVDFCGLWLETIARDGEVLVRKHARGPHGYQLELIDPTLLDERLNNVLPNGHKIRMGIEYDRWNAPVAYYLSQVDLADPMHWGWASGYTHERVPADQISHRFIVEMIGQARGIPWMAASMSALNQLGGFDESALVASRVGAAQGGFFVPDAENPPTEDLSPMADAVEGEGAAEQLVMDAEPGVFRAIPQGYTFEKFDPTYPHQLYATFVKAVLRRVASGLGVSYNGLANDLEGVNFSSIRAGLLEERDMWKALQRWMVQALLAPTYSEWLPRAIVSGGLNLPFDKLAKFDAAVWQGRRWDWVDPLKDVSANVTAAQNGLKSYSQIIRESGRDPNEVWAELEADRKRLGAMGMALDAKPGAPAAAGKPTEEEIDETGKAQPGA
jgi:lambda family phage portal protein